MPQDTPSTDGDDAPVARSLQFKAIFVAIPLIVAMVIFVLVVHNHPNGTGSPQGFAGNPAASNGTPITFPGGGVGHVPPTPQPCLTPAAASVHVTPQSQQNFMIYAITIGGQSAEPRIRFAPDGSLWMLDPGMNAVARLTPDDALHTYPIPNGKCDAEFMLIDPVGNLWFSEDQANALGRVTPNGQVTLFALPTAQSTPDQPILGPDGNIWFTEQNGNKIGRITESGALTEFPIPTQDSDSQIIVAGPDGNLWFTEDIANKIGRITPSGQITEFPLPSDAGGIFGIAAGPDGNVWFTASGIGRITPAGQITMFPIAGVGAFGGRLTVGPDGAFWFVATKGPLGDIVRVTTGGVAQLTPLPGNAVGATPLAFGADGRGWLMTVGQTDQLVTLLPNGTVSAVTLPDVAQGSGFLDAPAIAPDGSIWVAAGGDVYRYQG